MIKSFIFCLAAGAVLCLLTGAITLELVNHMLRLNDERKHDR